jgi:hypothetical protein
MIPTSASRDEIRNETIVARFTARISGQRTWCNRAQRIAKAEAASIGGRKSQSQVISRKLRLTLTFCTVHERK